MVKRSKRSKLIEDIESDSDDFHEDKKSHRNKKAKLKKTVSKNSSVEDSDISTTSMTSSMMSCVSFESSNSNKIKTTKEDDYFGIEKKCTDVTTKAEKTTKLKLLAINKAKKATNVITKPVKTNTTPESVDVNNSKHELVTATALNSSKKDENNHKPLNCKANVSLGCTTPKLLSPIRNKGDSLKIIETSKRKFSSTTTCSPRTIRLGLSRNAKIPSLHKRQGT